MAFHGGQPFVRVAARFVRAGAFLTGGTAGGQHIKIRKFPFQFLPDLPADLFMAALCLQTDGMIPCIFHLNHRRKKDKIPILPAFFHIFMDVPAVGRARPGMSVPLTVRLADILDFVGKRNLTDVSKAVFTDGIRQHRRLYDLFPF